MPLLETQVRFRFAQGGLGGYHVGPPCADRIGVRRRSQRAERLQAVGKDAVVAGVRQSQEDLQGHARLGGGGAGRLGVQLELLRGDFDPALIGGGDLTRTKPHLGDLGLLAQGSGRLHEHTHVFLGLRRRD